MKTLRRLLIAFLSIPLLAASAAGSTGVVAQNGQSTAGLVIQFLDNKIETYCIPFDGDSISGLDLLLKSGLDLKVQAYGGLGAEVCQIGSTGCDYPNQSCACQSFGPGGVYWSYHHLKGDRWLTSALGAGSYRVHNGDVDGWAWSDGKPPKVYTFSELCPAAKPAPAATDSPIVQRPTGPPGTALPPKATHTPRPPLPTPTHKPLPTITNRPATPTARAATATPASPGRGDATRSATSTPQASGVLSLPPTRTPTPNIPPSPPPVLQPTGRPTTIPALTLTPTTTAIPGNPQGTPGKQEDAARAIGLVIGAVVLGSLGIWGATAAIRRRSKGGGSHVG